MSTGLFNNEQDADIFGFAVTPATDLIDPKDTERFCSDKCRTDDDKLCVPGSIPTSVLRDEPITSGVPFMIKASPSAQAHSPPSSISDPWNFEDQGVWTTSGIDTDDIQVFSDVKIVDESSTRPLHESVQNEVPIICNNSSDIRDVAVSNPCGSLTTLIESETIKSDSQVNKNSNSDNEEPSAADATLANNTNTPKKQKYLNDQLYGLSSRTIPLFDSVSEDGLPKWNDDEIAAPPLLVSDTRRQSEEEFVRNGSSSYTKKASGEVSTTGIPEAVVVTDYKYPLQPSTNNERPDDESMKISNSNKINDKNDKSQKLSKMQKPDLSHFRLQEMESRIVTLQNIIQRIESKVDTILNTLVESSICKSVPHSQTYLTVSKTDQMPTETSHSIIKKNIYSNDETLHHSPNSNSTYQEFFRLIDEKRAAEQRERLANEAKARREEEELRRLQEKQLAEQQRKKREEVEARRKNLLSSLITNGKDESSSCGLFGPPKSRETFSKDAALFD